MLLHLFIEKHEKVVIPVNVTSWKSQKINTQLEKPIFYNRINWFLKNTKKKKKYSPVRKIKHPQKFREKQYFKGQRPVCNTAPDDSTTVRIVLPFNKDQDSKFSAQTTLRPNGEDSTGVR